MNGRETLYSLIDRVLAHELTVEDFVDRYTKMFLNEVDDAMFRDSELPALRALFEVASWYVLPEERRVGPYPKYKNEEDVFGAARQAKATRRNAN